MIRAGLSTPKATSTASAKDTEAVEMVDTMGIIIIMEISMEIITAAVTMEIITVETTTEMEEIITATEETSMVTTDIQGAME